MNAESFYQLTPDNILSACDRLGFRTSGQMIALNSLENRVYLLELENPLPQDHDIIYRYSPKHLVIKFYRPNRWSTDEILEEHNFSHHLASFEIPVITPLKIKNETLFKDPQTGLYYSLFYKAQGRLRDEYTQDEAKLLGRLIGRIHNQAQDHLFKFRKTFNPIDQLDQSMEVYSQSHIAMPYKEYLIELIKEFKNSFSKLSFSTNLKLHGDYHRGNVLWNESEPVVLDFDDSLNGPREYDLWLMIPMHDNESSIQKTVFLEEYQEMTKITSLNLNHQEYFRQLRMINYSAWVLKRWDDPIFPLTFAQYETELFWQQQYMDLKEFIGASYLV